MSQGPDPCARVPAFPATVFNRPALPRVAVRIGDYALMRAHILAQIDAAPALALWTHRGSDDPGIALAEGAALVGHLLALYQDDYANECLLRTATLDASVRALVRLGGYLPAPGLGGRARFALGVKGPQPVTVPAGLALQATLEGAAKPAVFETAAEHTAWPELSQFHLHRPRSVPAVRNGMQVFQLGAADDVALKAGDKLMVALAVGPADNQAYDHLQVMDVDSTWSAYGIRYVKTKGTLQSLGSGPPAIAQSALAQAAVAITSTNASTSVAAVGFSAQPALRFGNAAASTGVAVDLDVFANTTLQAAQAVKTLTAQLPAWSGTLAAGLAVARVTQAPKLVAWKLGPSHRHFGHSAPAIEVSVDANGHGVEKAVSYFRLLGSTQGAPAGPAIAPLQLPLDGPAPAVAAGTTVLVEANLQATAGSTARKRLLQRQVRQLDTQAMAWGAQTGQATVLTLDSDLAIKEGSTTYATTDIRAVTVHAVQGAAFELLAEPRNTAATSGAVLDYYGSDASAAALPGRTLLLLEPAGPRPVVVQQVALATTGEPRWHVTLDQVLGYALYGHDDPAVPVHGNLVDATEGETQPELVLGSGDQRAVFQTFAIPKPPLTYLLDPAQSPPQVPELQVWVGGVLWQAVPSFFDAGPRDTVYILREDEAGQTWVQFGDGQRGARLPSGQGNVVASWRVGQGSTGPLKADSSVSAKPRFAGFDKAWMPEPATGGALPEPASSVRLAAPAAMQSLGRIVSLADLEAEAQSLPGVLRARAGWRLADGAPVLTLAVLTDGLALADRQALDAALRSAVAARGAARHALWLTLANRRFVSVGLRIGYSATLRTDSLLAAVKLALGTSGDDIAADDLPTGGLFDWRARQIGQDVHGSQVLGRVQNIPGVAWVQLQSLGFVLAPALSLAANALPLAGSLVQPAVQRRLACPPNTLLALHDTGLAVTWEAVA